MPFNSMAPKSYREELEDIYQQLMSPLKCSHALDVVYFLAFASLLTRERENEKQAIKIIIICF